MLINPESWSSSLHMYTRYGFNRVNASFVHPVFLGVFVMQISLLNLIICNNIDIAYRHIKRVRCVIQIILSPFLIFVTGSRTSVMAFLIASTFLVFMTLYKKRIRRLILNILIFIIIILILFFIFIGEDIKAFIYHSVVEKEATQSIESKHISMIDGIKYLSSNFNWIGENNRQFTGDWTLKNYELSNGFINRFSMYGIFYFVLYVFVWIIGFRNSLKIYKTNTVVGLILFLSLIYLFFVSMVLELDFQNEILFFIFIGLSMNKFFLKDRDYFNHKILVSTDHCNNNSVAN